MNKPLIAALALLVAGCTSASRQPTAACEQTPAQRKWPTEYGDARGTKEIWLIDNGGGHQAGQQRKVAWRVVGPTERLSVTAERPDGQDSFTLTIRDRVYPNGQDRYPDYWDSVSYLKFPSPGCWRLSLQAGTKAEQIILDVK